MLLQNKNVTTKFNTSKYSLVRLPPKERDYIKLSTSDEQEFIYKLHCYAPSDAKSADYFFEYNDGVILVRYYTDLSGKYVLNENYFNGVDE